VRSAAVAAAAVAAVAIGATTTTAATSPAPPPGPSAHAPANPLGSAAMRALLRSRAGSITAAIYDIRSRHLYAYRRGVQEYEASIAKVDIVAVLLAQAQRRGALLDPAQQQLAAASIEQSANQQTQLLWNETGYNPAIAAFNASVGMRDTTLDPAGIWGRYQTTAIDQVILLDHLVEPNPVLGPAARAYELGLMRAVVAWQAWGVSAGVLAPATVALKNGWAPIVGTAGWQVNSIGWVSGRGRDYLIAVLTGDDPGYAYGVATIAAISALVWSELRRAPAPTAGTRRRRR